MERPVPLRKGAVVSMSPSVANLLAAQRTMLEMEPEKKEKTRFFKTPRLGSRRVRNRLVQKTGICNISLKNVPKQRRKYFSDIFTTVIEMKWRWCLLYFSLNFVLSWTFFAVIYYSISVSHGDLESWNLRAANWTPCVQNADSELNFYLFSFATQTTIGYGYRYPTDQCPLVVLAMSVQFMWGILSQTLMAGVIFSKLARPIKRAATLIFSKNAVICMRDGKLCLLFRVGDMRKSSLAEAHVRLQMIKRCITYEGELLPFHQFDMDVGYDEGLDRVFVIWPITICHEIDENSPLYDVSKESLATAKFEIIAILEGVVESVGSTTQARTSYLPNEILWGKRFEKLVHYKKENGQYHIDFQKFHNVYDVKTPPCSAKELDEMRNAGTFNEKEYQIYHHDSQNALNIDAIDDIPEVTLTNDISVVPQITTNPHVVLRMESDDENSGEECGGLELVECGGTTRHKRSIRSISPTSTELIPLQKKMSMMGSKMFSTSDSHHLLLWQPLRDRRESSPMIL
ncbi:unnamed protein product, partial [Mesorhabditis belari]|uniref:Uncharacterized protein n=1 Tax=Mesorhabditis belari TaxID=2138241 RepID=A0AAF3JA74_9BILA